MVLRKISLPILLGLTIVMASCGSQNPMIQNTNQNVENLNTNVDVSTEVNANFNINANTNSEIAAVLENKNENSRSMFRKPLVATRQAPEGCRWKETSYTQIPVRFLRFDCPNEPSPAFLEEGTQLKSFAIDTSFPFLEAFQKHTGETEQDAIQREILSKLPPKAQQDCRVVISQHGRKGASRYEISLTPEREAAQEKIGDDSFDYITNICGPYAQTNGIQYFEFQPGKNTFLFVTLGQDGPGVDQDSIEILK